MGITSNKTNKSLHVWECIIAFGYIVYTSGKTPSVHSSSSIPDLLYFSKTILNCILHLAQQHDFVVEGVGSNLACLQSRPFTSWTHLKRQETKSMWKISQNCWNSQNGTSFLSSPASWCPQFPGVYGLFWDRQLFLRRVAVFAQLKSWTHVQ